MSNYIFARSPFIVEINETGQTGSKIEIFLWHTGFPPTTPTHTLSKPIPSNTNLQTTYNISPYIREFIDHNEWQVTFETIEDTPTNQFCNVRIKRYKLFGGLYVLLDTISYLGFDGYGYYEDGFNPNLGSYFLTQGTYYYHYDENIELGSTKLASAGQFTFDRTDAPVSDIKYINLKSGSSEVWGVGEGAIKDAFRVNPKFYPDGNIVLIMNSDGGTLARYVFKPIHECRNQVYVCDFVNRYGAWQREFFFGASNEQIDSTSTSYNLMQSNLVNYDVLEGQRKEFNANGIRSIKLNTGIRDESMNIPLQELMLSERILLDGLPVKLRSKSLAKLKVINTKIINYAIEFEYANDIINSVV